VIVVFFPDRLGWRASCFACGGVFKIDLSRFSGRSQAMEPHRNSYPNITFLATVTPLITPITPPPHPPTDIPSVRTLETQRESTGEDSFRPARTRLKREDLTTTISPPATIPTAPVPSRPVSPRPLPPSPCQDKKRLKSHAALRTPISNTKPYPVCPSASGPHNYPRTLSMSTDSRRRTVAPVLNLNLTYL